MDPIAVTVGIWLLAILIVVIFIWQRWAAKRLANRLLSDAIATMKDDERPKLKPECDFVVSMSREEVTCQRPDGTMASVKWGDLHKVEVLTSDVGPFAPDIFWALYDSNDVFVVPWGADGEIELLDRLQQLPGFRNDVIVEAASLTTDKQLVCWQRVNELS